MDECIQRVQGTVKSKKENFVDALGKNTKTKGKLSMVILMTSSNFTGIVETSSSLTPMK